MVFIMESKINAAPKSVNVSHTTQLLLNIQIIREDMITLLSTTTLHLVPFQF